MTKVMVTIGSFFLMALTAMASGFGIYEQGPTGQGNSGAYAARAEDASAVYHNPAGLAQLNYSELMLSARGLFNRSYYSNPGQTTWKAKIGNEVGPSFFLNFKLSRFALGLGSMVSQQYKHEWDDPTFPGRFLNVGTELLTTEQYGALAFKFTDRFSMGFTGRFAQTESSFSLAHARPMDSNDPSLHYEALESYEADGTGSGFSLGFQYKVPRRFSIGLVYWSPIEIDLEGTRTFSQYSQFDDPRATASFAQLFAPLNNSTTTSAIELPERITVGYLTKVTVRTRLEIDLATEKWSTVQNLNYQVSDGTTHEAPQNWEDSFSVRIAGDFQQRKALLWRASFGYTAGVVPDETVNAYYPDHDRFMYGFGVSWKWRPNIMIEGAWSYVQNRDRFVPNQELVYDPNGVDYLQVNGVEGNYETQRSHVNVGIRWIFGKKAGSGAAPVSAR